MHIVVIVLFYKKFWGQYVVDEGENIKEINREENFASRL